MDLRLDVPRLLERHPAVTRARLVGSRQRGDAGPLSDWDFLVETDDPDALRRELPGVVKDLPAIAAQWERLGERWSYMLILKGGVKVDIELEGTKQVHEPPWEVTAETLPGIDLHFWDWILWLGSKSLKDDDRLLSKELQKLSEHLLRPMNVQQVPGSIEAAVAAYLEARDRLRDELGVRISIELQEEVLDALRRSGLAV